MQRFKLLLWNETLTHLCAITSTCFHLFLRLCLFAFIQKFACICKNKFGSIHTIKIGRVVVPGAAGALLPKLGFYHFFGSCFNVKQNSFGKMYLEKNPKNFRYYQYISGRQRRPLLFNIWAAVTWKFSLLKRFIIIIIYLYFSFIFSISV